MGDWEDWAGSGSDDEGDSLEIPGVTTTPKDLGEAEEGVVAAAWDDSDEDSGEEVGKTKVAGSQPKNPDKKKGIAPLASIRKKKAREARKARVNAAEKEPLTAKQQRELQEKAEEELTADTFGVGSKGRKDMFDKFDASKGELAFTRLAAQICARVSEWNEDLYYVHFVQELARELCSNMNVDEMASVVASIEVVKQAKLSKQRGKTKKKKKTKKVSRARVEEDFVEDEYAGFM